MNSQTALTEEEIKEFRDLIAKPTPRETTSVEARQPNNAWLRLAGVLVATIVFWVVIIGIQALDSHLGKTRTTSTLSSAEVVDLYDKNQRIDSSRLAKFMEEQQKKIGDENQKTIEYQNQRIGDTWSAVQGIGLISAIIGVLITVLVLYFSFQNSDAINGAKDDFEKKLKVAAAEHAKYFIQTYIKTEAFTSTVNTQAENTATTFLNSKEFRLKVIEAIRKEYQEQPKSDGEPSGNDGLLSKLHALDSAKEIKLDAIIGSIRTTFSNLTKDEFNKLTPNTNYKEIFLKNKNYFKAYADLNIKYISIDKKARILVLEVSTDTNSKKHEVKISNSQG